jgi:hypothetical protein
VQPKSVLMTAILFFAIMACPISHFAVAQDAKSGPQTIKGELLLLAGEVGVVKDSEGKTTHLNVTKATKLEGNVKAGDKVEVSVSGDGQALSIKPSK